MHVHRDLVLAQQLPVVGNGARFLLWGVLGIDIPQSVAIGEGFVLAHGGYGVVVYHGTSIGRNVIIYQGVTIGLKELRPDETVTPIVIEDGVVLCAGAKVLAPREGLTVRRGTVVGANAVLMESTGEDEVWAGIPARRVKSRHRSR
jgi:serine O-acetyltransferase